MSIQRYLFLLIISIVTLATFGAALHGYRAAMSELEMILDQELVSLAHSLTSVKSTEVVVKQENQTPFAYQVWQNQQLVVRSSNSPEIPLTGFTQGFGYKNFLGARWRVYCQQFAQRWVMVAQRQNQRIVSAERVLLTSITPVVITIPLIGLLVLLAVRTSLSPLRNLSKQLKAKSADELEPVALVKNSKELEPIVDTINSVLARLKSSFAREKRLASDAAHELRTPISVLNIAAHNLVSSYQNNSLTTDSFEELQQGVERMAHVVEQILALNRTSPENFNHCLVALDIQSILQSVIAKLYVRIEDKQQTVSLDSQSYWVKGDEFSLQTLFENLVSNANKYAGKGCEIKLSTQLNGQELCVIVEDNGPGIAVAEREKIFDRFYRLEQARQNTGVTGCGLGMSIVKHIVELHQGRIALEQSVLGGLKVLVFIPLAQGAQRQSNGS
ncbi:two-component sensor histidine kinase [Thalassotalea insulae]|uniref:histidine kinase n=1 Tax=Thalassotalea insulae TaxID=2056778 RepID=A0ABQ6GMK8_9GAMM|nr:HAMP domain-containing sensor histidine kinase [Thalassotalea insulae]GLX77096.1 two-component sensor histidine kinase [Thalassotalea insulae]